MYLAVIGVPFLSTRLTVTPVARPTNSGSGVKVTFPASSIVYVPSPGTFFSVVPSSKVGLTVSSISTGISLPLIVTFPPSNVGVPDWGCPFGPSDSESFEVGVTGITTGVYLAVIGVPFLSTRLTVTPVAWPVNVFSGVKVTFPVSSIVYVPSPGIVFSVVPSSNVGLTVSSISTVFSIPLTLTFPPSNVGVPVWVAPWTSVVITSELVGVAGLTTGVYLAFTGVPFSSTRWTSTPVPFPVNCGSGLNSTIPLFTV